MLSTTLLSLPAELLSLIADLLPLKYVSLLSRTCHHLRVVLTHHLDTQFAAQAGGILLWACYWEKHPSIISRVLSLPSRLPSYSVQRCLFLEDNDDPQAYFNVLARHGALDDVQLDWCTQLANAIELGDIDLAKAALENGWCPNLRLDFDGFKTVNAMELAEARGNNEMLRLFKQYGGERSKEPVTIPSEASVRYSAWVRERARQALSQGYPDQPVGLREPMSAC